MGPQGGLCPGEEEEGKRDFFRYLLFVIYSVERIGNVCRMAQKCEIQRELGDSLGNFEGYFSSQYFWPIANSVALGMRDDRA